MYIFLFLSKKFGRKYEETTLIEIRKGDKIMKNFLSFYFFII